MTITLRPELESRLLEKAAREGVDPSAVAESLVEAALNWEELDRDEAIIGIRRGLEASQSGRVRNAREVLADLQSRLPSNDS